MRLFPRFIKKHLLFEFKKHYGQLLKKTEGEFKPIIFVCNTSICFPNQIKKYLEKIGNNEFIIESIVILLGVAISYDFGNKENVF